MHASGHTTVYFYFRIHVTQVPQQSIFNFVYKPQVTPKFILNFVYVRNAAGQLVGCC
jgi:hypothetical protein